MGAETNSGKKAFSEKMLAILNYGAVNLAMAIGYRTGLFDVMDSLDRPREAVEIAGQAGLDARYVREWLGVMATAEIVELSRAADGRPLFYLPKAHADYITRRSGNNNLGVYTQEIPLLTDCAMEAVIDGFYTGEGVTYDHYPKFQAFMSELADAKHRQVLVDVFLPSIEDGRLVQRLKSGIRVCDLGCAEGVAVMLMARAFPKSRFTGIDISVEAIDTARRETRRQGIENLELVVMDAARIKEEDRLRGAFDYVTAFDAIHDQTRPLEALRGVFHMLAPGGRFSMVDIAAESDIGENLDHPMGPFLYTVSLMHCMPVGLVSGGTGLGMMWGRQKAMKLIAEAGFEDVQLLDIPEDPFNDHYYCRK